MKSFFYIAFFVLWGSPFASAQLQWKERQLEFSPAPSDTELTAKFEFSNPTDHTITITSIQSSCGCTTTELEKKTYQPGEAGTLDARFVFGDSTGHQKKTIAVQTDDPVESKVLLRLQARIPELLSISPAYVFWKQYETPQPQQVMLEVEGDNVIHVTNVKSRDPNIAIQWEAVQPGKSYRIDITPQVTDRVIQAILEISTDFPADKPRTFHAYAVIVSPGRQILAPTTQPSREGKE